MTGETVITVIGNLTADPELRFTSSGIAVANFTVASTPRTFDKASGEWNDGDPLFLRCTIWRQAAENVAESLTKGARVIVVGRLVQRSFEVADGSKRTVHEMQADEVGPALKYATARVTRTPGRGVGTGNTNGTGAPADDPWAAVPAGGGTYSDEPPVLMAALTIGSLFAGYDGLGMALAEVFDTERLWFSEFDPAPSKILAWHWPDVPNLGDITAIDWSTVPRPDIITGGFPCQDVSMAGRRAGLGPGTRTGLWSRMANAIDILRPALVVAENVRGLLSAETPSDVEPCPWCVGDDATGHMRALGAVLGDLADLGYDAAWYGLAASDVGAPHGRFRIFILAWPVADSNCFGHKRSGRARVGRAGLADSGDDAADTARHPWRVVHGDGSASTADRDRERLQGAQPTPGRYMPAWGIATNSDRGRLESGAQLDCDPAADTADRRAPGRHSHRRSSTEWGKYADAVGRWESALGRAAPPPTETTTKGTQRLSPPFVEWMMGLPAGHVTATPGLTRVQQLKALGNGVVPGQAEAAVRHLLAAVAA